MSNQHTFTYKSVAFFLTTIVWFQLVAQTIVNDVTQLNPINVNAVIAPTTTFEIVEAVKSHTGPISIGGGRYSMGGQTATEQSLQIDMRHFDSIIDFSKENKEITVQAGITWRKIQQFIDQYDLSVQIMQTYANFTVGGSLSVNVHGRYIGQGPLVLSVKQIKIVLANGQLITASTTENDQIFYAAIGGYGGLGVITQATLNLADNSKIERTDKVFPINHYPQFFAEQIRSDTLVVFHNADIYPNRYNRIRAISFSKTLKNVTVKHRLKPNNKKYKFNKLAFKIISDFPFGKWIRQHVVDPIIFCGNPVEWRNYEASYDVLELEPKSRRKTTYVLQEYFVPVDKFNSFYPQMVSILKKHNVNVINISIRHAKADPGTFLRWANTEVFAFVIYYKQGTTPENKIKVEQWTQQLIDAAIINSGSYYLPYQIYATNEQFLKAYPNALKFFALKKELDPTNKFSNKLWDKYYTP